jgi:hypothetical protein
MIITPDFVFVHMPKTGGTFVSQLLKQIYGEEAQEAAHKHATCDEIPAHVRNLPIVSVMRSPWQRYVSQYHYAWWKTHPEAYCDPQHLTDAYKHYPNLSFAEFVDAANRFFINAHRQSESGFVNHKLSPEQQMGWHTEQFIRFFCRNPQQTFASVDAEQLAQGHLNEHEYAVHFLFTETLNRDLSQLLDACGHGTQVLAQVQEHAAVLPDDAFEQRPERSMNEYYDDALCAFLLRREQLLFKRFPRYTEAPAIPVAQAAFLA